MSVCSPVSASISSPRLLLNVLKDVTYAQSAPGHVRSVDPNTCTVMVRRLHLGSCGGSEEGGMGGGGGGGGGAQGSAQVCSKNNLRTLPPSDRDSDTECNTRGGGEEVAEDMCYGILRA